MLTTRQETFAQGLAEGLTQREAYQRAYPNSRNWKVSTVQKRASELAAKQNVRKRYEELKERAAKKAVISRAKMLKRLDNLADKSEQVIERVYEKDGRISYNASQALISASKELLPYAEDDTKDDKPPFVADFGLLLAPDFLQPHRMIANREATDFWMGGGRASAKSCCASFEVVKDIEENPDHHALIMMRYKNQIRDSAYAQVVWAIQMLGLEDDYDMPDSTLRIVKRSTGQVIYFKGCDNPNKVKGIKPKFGYVGIIWLEECDMFRGMAEIRKVLQSATRGGEDCIRLFTFNPPRSKQCWINEHVQALKDAGKPYFESNYLRVPVEWLGEKFIEDAEELKRTDPQAYKHEYLGIPVGLGGDVFDRVVFREITDAEIDTFDHLRCGQDFGWFPDPWAYTMSEWQPAQRRLLTWYEDVANYLQAWQQAKRIHEALTWSDDGKTEVYHRARVLSDDAEPQTIAAQREQGVDARAAGKGNMRDASYRFLQTCEWVIDPVRCPRLAKEVREKQYEQTDEGEWLNVIPDGKDHCIDATRYAMMREVRARRGWRPATAQA